MDCVVTGGAGFIGSNLVDALVDRGHQVTVIDNLSTGRRSNLDQALEHGVALHEVDVRDAESVSEVIAVARPELVGPGARGENPGDRPGSDPGVRAGPLLDEWAG